MRRWQPISAAALALCGSFAHAQNSQAACDRVQTLAHGTSTTITAEYRLAGPLRPSSVSTPGFPLPDLPAHCEVRLTATAGAGSEVAVEVWLPDPGTWNGKMIATGNGGYSGALSYFQMAEGLRRGYAVAGSNTGHQGDGLTFGVNHPEKIRDWAYRSTHLLAQEAKATAKAFYGSSPAHSYFVGCSTGGQQALSEAQRYPGDFDGIVAGDPGNDRILLNADFVESWLITHPSAGNTFPSSKLQLLNRAAVTACDKQDGVADGIISDPRTCTFDPASLACHGTSKTDSCLTDSEINMVKLLYEGPVRDAENRPIYPGWSRGSEAGWGTYIVSPAQPVRSEFWSSWIFGSSDFDVRKFDAPAAISAARLKIPFVEAVNPDLRPFQKAGGKLLMYHGWADPVVPPEDTIHYFQRVQRILRGKTADSVRLFMVPGMGHCGGGPGASTFDALGALDLWVSGNKAPESILASHIEAGKPPFTRPLCAYPKAALWDGRNDPSQASSFRCAENK